MKETIILSETYTQGVDDHHAPRDVEQAILGTYPDMTEADPLPGDTYVITVTITKEER